MSEGIFGHYGTLDLSETPRRRLLSPTHTYPHDGRGICETRRPSRLPRLHLRRWETSCICNSKGDRFVLSVDGHCIASVDDIPAALGSARHGLIPLTMGT